MYQLSEDRIQEIVVHLAHQVQTQVQYDANVIVLGTLTGSFIFTADFVRYLELNNSFQIGFCSAQSYSQNIKTSKPSVTFHSPTLEKFEGATVIVTEDIIDSGDTIGVIINSLIECKVSKIIVVSLLKREGLRLISTSKVQYLIGDIVPTGAFVVGYGMDDNDRWRDIRFIKSINS